MQVDEGLPKDEAQAHEEHRNALVGAAKKLDRAISDAAVKGIDTGGMLPFPLPPSLPPLLLV